MSQSGQGRIRIINFAMLVNSDLTKVFQSADQEIVTNMLLREASLSLSVKPLEDIVQGLKCKVVDILYAYRIHVISFH